MKSLIVSVLTLHEKLDNAGEACEARVKHILQFGQTILLGKPVTRLLSVRCQIRALGK